MKENRAVVCVRSNCFKAITFLFSITIILVSPSLAIIHSDTYWSIQTSPTTKTLFNVKAVSDSISWTSGQDGVVLRTTDGGSSWSLVPLPVTHWINTLTAVDANIAFVATSFMGAEHFEAKLWKTTNGGISWIVKENITTTAGDVPRIIGIHMFDATNGYYIGNPIGVKWVLKKTTDGGETWVDAATLYRDPIYEHGYDNSMMWYNKTYGWFSGISSIIYRTSDGGTSWTGISSINNPSSLWFNKLTLGISACRRSQDTGLTWSEIPCPVSNSQSYSGLFDSDEFWIIGESNGSAIFYTSDAGDSWTKSPPHGYSSDSILHQMSVIKTESGVFGWAVGKGGTILRYHRPTITSVNEKTRNRYRFALYQNFPNPFNPTTTIAFEIPQDSHINITILDMLGRELFTLADESLPAGFHRKTINFHTLSSGLYFYRLQTSFGVITKKMLAVR